MIQNILALLTVLGAIMYMAWGIYRVLAPRKDQSSTFCSGCPSGGCSISSIKQKSNTYK